MSAHPIARVYGRETYREKATRKFKENPWVPIGAAATTVALLVAMVKMRRGQSRSFNHWLRARVVAQGLTIVAIVAGSYTFREQDTAVNKTQLEINAQRKIEKDRMEFEERMRAAEASYESEAGRVGMKNGSDGKQAEPKSGDVSVSPVAGRGWWGGSRLWWSGQRNSNSPSDSNRSPDTGAAGTEGNSSSTGESTKIR